MPAKNLTPLDLKLLNSIRMNPGQTPLHIFDLNGTAPSSGYYSIEKLIAFNMLDGKEEQSLTVNNTFGYFLGVSVGKVSTRIVLMDWALHAVPIRAVLKKLNKTDETQIFWDESTFCPLTDTEKDKTDAVWHFDTASNSLLSFKAQQRAICKFALNLSEKIHLLSVSFTFGDHVDPAAKDKELREFNLIKDSQTTDQSLFSFAPAELRSMEKQGVVICCEQNAKSAAIAEFSITNGCLADYPNKAGSGLVLYLGRGLGCAIIESGHVLRGRTNAAGIVLGHQQVEYEEDNPDIASEVCEVCKRKGCLETLIIHQALKDPDAEKAGTDALKDKSGAELVQLLNRESKKKDKENLVKYLARAVAQICDLLECQYIVADGKLAAIFRDKNIEEQFDTKLTEYRSARFSTAPEIIVSDLAENSAAVGACVCGYNKWCEKKPRGRRVSRSAQLDRA